MHYCKAALRTVQASIKYKNQKSHFHLHVMTLWFPSDEQETGCNSWRLKAHKQVFPTHHGLSQSFLDQVDTALVHGLAIWQEAALKRRGYRGQTLRGKGGKRTRWGADVNGFHWHGVLFKKRFWECFKRKLTSNKGKRSLSSSLSWFHFWISGGINIWMYSWKTRDEAFIWQ